MKKYLAVFAPILATAAFAVAPAMAQAQTTAYGVVKAGVFEAFTAPTAVVSEGTKAFVLEEAKGEKIECKSLADEGTLENVSGVGHSALTLSFDECTLTTGALAGCSVSTPGAPADTIVGTVTDVVLKETEVEITVTGGFELETESPCPVVALGTVTGKATGTEAKGSNELVFNKATRLFLGAEAANITGTDATFTEAAHEAVVIN